MRGYLLLCRYIKYFSFVLPFFVCYINPYIGIIGDVDTLEDFLFLEWNLEFEKFVPWVVDFLMYHIISRQSC